MAKRPTSRSKKPSQAKGASRADSSRSKKAPTKKKAAAKKAAKPAAKPVASASKERPAAKARAAKTPATTKAAATKPGKKSTGKAPRRAKVGNNAGGKQLVIVESPAKARTINNYLGDDFVVMASVGHIRDLPNRAPKGTKQPVPGVDVENDFRPTYEVLAGKSQTVADLKREAKTASQIWFATDLDREGEAIAWHLAQVLGLDASEAKRVVFNAITRDEIRRAFANPRPIDENKVNAQQARRILDRIVGYQASPLLWKKVARNLSAGRVQSVAVRLIVEREREIEAFVPDEEWRVTAWLATDPERGPELEEQWQRFLAELDDKGKGPTVKQQNHWLAGEAAVRGELVELGGEKFAVGCTANAPRDLGPAVGEVARACGLVDVQIQSREDPEGKGPARWLRSVTGRVDPTARYRVSSIESKQTFARVLPPFITSSLQIAASTFLGFSAQRTMRAAQGLYEGVALQGLGQVALITYMRTDSTHLSPDAVQSAREFIESSFGATYLPDAPRSFSSSNKSAQEAHEAIRPNDVGRHPDELRGRFTGPNAADLERLYRLIWSRFVACQMERPRWNATTVLLERSDQATGAVFRATGRTLEFDGFYRVTGVPTSGDELNLPVLARGHELGPFGILPEQKFSSPPPRYSEASLVKTLEQEGIGRPSTYASIIKVIQDRNYVEQVDRRFHATDLGEVVTDKLVEAFPDILEVGYTREMEKELDEVEEARIDWVEMLRGFYTRFTADLEKAHEDLSHAKAELQPAPYACPKCGSPTCYRFGKNGRFLSCTTFPACDYAAPIDRRGRPLLPERVDVVCPVDGSGMELRNGRFGPFLASINYPKTEFVLNIDKKRAIKYPSIPPLVIAEIECPKCKSAMNLRRGKRGPWLGCSRFPKCRGRQPFASLADDQKEELEKLLLRHEKANPQPRITRADGSVIPEGTPVSDLLLPGGVAELALHPAFSGPSKVA